MKIRKWISLFLTLALIPGILCGCTSGGEKETAGSTGDTSAATDGTVADGTEPTWPATTPLLNSLTVDGGYALDFDPEVNTYTVSLPAGRPRVPQVEAEAEDGAEVRILQATIADGETSGTAKVILSRGGMENAYTVEFVKDESLGFQLQYADIYLFEPAYTLKDGESFTFASSDKAVASVAKSGKVTAKARSDTPVTITASVNGTVVDELVIDKVIKAPLNIFLIMGQSNALGWHDVPPEYSTYYAYASTQKAISDRPAAGTVWCDDISNGYDDYTFTGMYDLSVGRSGFSPALGKEWYALTGEKTLMIQTAVGSSPIETWVRDPSLKFFGLDCYAITVERFNYYRDLLSKENSDFEINRIYGFWLQGETGEEYVYSPGVFTWAFKHNIPNYSYNGDWLPVTGPGQLITSKQYSDYFLGIYDALMEDVGLEFIGILPVRAMYSVSTRENRTEQTLVDLVPTRAAQFALNYTENGNISFVTLKTEIGRTESYADKTVEGWGYMGCNNIHYNQLGYNALGKDAADNTFAKFSANADHTAASLVVLDSNGKTQLEDGDVITLSVGQTHQISGYVLPLFADDYALTFEVADTSICTIDEFGLITASDAAVSAGKSTTVTVSNGELTKTITIKIAK